MVWSVTFLNLIKFISSVTSHGLCVIRELLSIIISIERDESQITVQRIVNSTSGTTRNFIIHTKRDSMYIHILRLLFVRPCPRPPFFKAKEITSRKGGFMKEFLNNL